ncbi:hypothetical protein ACFFQW_00570 [Umezawaea endophytica]|uniref:Uncharacterized protein n=1 Tax=Umezawaea endophytica TaxID=1654476 RepID=A0A9X2VHT5_9PSEU|nr:hypothetical protein [Umezawaea endophytica]MCS7476742.1 hypothetical protein [Umezawaea endophytica]
MTGGPAVLADLPTRAGWDFGDFPYGLEPLVLPEPLVKDASDGPQCTTVDEGSAELRYELGALPDCRRTAPGLDNSEQAHQLYWFRWITGHQTTFAVWQYLARALHEVEEGRDEERNLEVMGRLTEAYSAMLLYTSSCPNEVYHEVIRPSMFLQHRGFSGTWAPDFVPVRKLLRGKRFPWSGSEAGEELNRQVRLYHDVHAGIAAKLVPGGRSLLQETAVETKLLHPEMRSVLYDNYFMTLRSPVGEEEIARQLVRRLKAIALDVTDKGLYPGQDADSPDLPREFHQVDVADCERRFTDIVTGLVALVAGLEPLAAPEG